MKIVVGLGNPGAKYAGTRHNVGYAVVDYLAAGPGAGRPRERFEAEVVELTEGDAQLLLVKPLTFMNLSGRSVRQLLDFYKLPVGELLVVCDDISLPLGKLRARARGSHGGHNGLRNIQDHLGTQDYARLRIGVDAPRYDDAVDHVLGRFRPGERPVIEEAVAAAAQAVLLWARQGIDVVMNRVNGPADAEKPKKPKKPPAESGAKTEPPPEPNP
jgi:PTH1 family peptidyl-tRNA hydrolase